MGASSSDISYSPYILVSIELDSLWSRKGACAVQPDIHTARAPYNLTQVCKNYRKKINERCNWRYKKYTTEDKNAKNNAPLDEHLYNPVHVAPCLHADWVSHILVDDFEAIQHITASTNQVERLSIGFPINKDELISNYRKERKAVLKKLEKGTPHLIDIHELFKENHGAPLITTTKLKLEGLCTLDHQLLYEHALYARMLVKIEDKIHELKKEAKDATLKCAAEPIGLSDIESIRYSFISWQSQAEVGLIISSNNLSLNTTLLVEAQKISFGELISYIPQNNPKSNNDEQKNETLGTYPISEHFKKRIEHFYSQSAPSQAQVKGYSHLPESGQNHSTFALHLSDNEDFDFLKESKHTSVFNWVNTTAGIKCTLDENQRKLSYENELMHCKGLIALTLDLQVLPNQYRSALEKIDNAKKTFFDKSITEDSLNYYQIGIVDLSTSPTDHLLLKISDCFSFVEEVKKLSDDEPRAIVDIISHFTVPHFADYCDTIKYRISPLKNRINQIKDQSHIIFDLEVLKIKPKLYKLPASLHNSLRSMYEHYVAILLNPHLFDLVIDLYDSFSTLYKTLTERLVTEHQVNKQDGLKYLAINGRKVVAISQFTTSLQNSFRQRLGDAHPTPHSRSASLDFHNGSGYLQILMSANAASRFGLSLLRYHTNGVSSSTGRLGFEDAGVLLESSIRPGIRAKRTEISYYKGERGGHLASIEADITHLMYAGSFVSYIHESYHLVYQEVIRLDENLNTRRLLLSKTDYQQARIEEVYVHALTHYFICGSDTDVFLHHFISQYSESSESVKSSLEESFRMFAEQFTRLFLGSTFAKILCNDELPDDYDEIPSRCDLQKKYEAALDLHGKFFLEYADLKQLDSDNKTSYQDLVTKACHKHLDVFLEETGILLLFPNLIKMTIPVLKSVRETVFGDLSKAERHEIQKSIDTSIISAMEAGNPLTQSHSIEALSRKSRPYIDSCLLGCRILRVYMTKRWESSSQKLENDPKQKPEHFHIYRNNGEVTEDSFRQNSSHFLIDRGKPHKICYTPGYRKIRLREQIVILRSLWGLSSHFRASRLTDILSKPESVK